MNHFLCRRWTPEIRSPTTPPGGCRDLHYLLPRSFSTPFFCSDFSMVHKHLTMNLTFSLNAGSHYFVSCDHARGKNMSLLFIKVHFSGLRWLRRKITTVLMIWCGSIEIIDNMSRIVLAKQFMKNIRKRPIMLHM